MINVTMGSSTAGESALFELARAGDEIAYRDLVEVHRAELHAHCYRMLGSLHDADDAVQDALVRAWRALPGFEGRSSLRTWLYKITTNTAIDLAKRRSRRELPVDPGPVMLAEGRQGSHNEPRWMEPYPDQDFGELEPSPEARYERHESLELAFVAALQHLPPRQRAVLILRDVMGYSAEEVAGLLDMSVHAANSALQRARDGAQKRIPPRSQQTTLRALGDDGMRRIVEGYVDAIERGDADKLVRMLTEDAVWAMPPIAASYRGREAIRGFLAEDVSRQRWRHVATRANGQVAVGCYTFDTDRALYVAAVIDVLTIEGDQIKSVSAFITADTLTSSGSYSRFIGSEVFPRFGLPAELPEIELGD